ncbi:MAG: ABC transporter permease [Bacteroidales bacterium]|nr:ABC transporter permease [Bacteroidales bacterium]MBN2698551.1 ABC transporter permease [Bacteroidales bacterium]
MIEYLFINFGKYFLMLKRIFARPGKFSIYYRQTITEVENLGINSFGIVVIISVFVGAVITIQTNYNIENPFLPKYLVGVTVRDSLLLEFSSTMVALILAGKVGSSIASEIGMMRVTEQIDALEIMGVNSASYLILPKIIASVIFFPVLCLISMIVGLFGGYLSCFLGKIIPPSDYIYGIQYAFYPHYISYALTKTVFYAFIIVTISAYYGYHVEGGAIEVGRSSTKAVVHSSVLILLANLILTRILLQ